MRPKIISFSLLILIVLTGCASYPQRTTVVPGATSQEPPDYSSSVTSLFPSDQAVLGDEAVLRILSSKLELPKKPKIAVMKFSDGQGSGYRFYWRDGDYLKLLQEQLDAMTQTLAASGQAVDVTPLPSLMTPSKISIPLLREAALRMQADMLLVFRIGNDTYSQSRVFSKDKVKAYSTCEMIVLDIRTGLVPFTRVVGREQQEQKESADLDLSEAMRRAEKKASAEALKTAAEDLVGFLKSVPRK